MCIVPFPVKSIESTRLFVLPSVDRKRQMTFYKNEVDSFDENIMILPFPGSKSIQLHKVRYKAMFDDLAKSVYQPPQRSYEFRELMCTASLTRSYEPLPVISHGSYLVSIAETLEDLKRVNVAVFDLPPDILPFFAKHYTSEFGYLVCKLKGGKHDYEPLCYSHDILSTGKLFVPTLHYHDHGNGAKTDNADWDHRIYSVGTSKMANRDYMSYKENKLIWTRFPEEFQLGKDIPVRCAEIEGHYPNKDIVFELDTYGPAIPVA